MRYNHDAIDAPVCGGNKVNVGAYIRVSTVFEEQDTSIINQEEGLNDYIKRNGWLLFETYSERQSSFKRREEFQRLIRDARNKKFQVVLVKSLSRFGRNIGELNTVVPELVEKGIRFIALAEDIDTDKSGWQSKLAMYSMVYQMTSQTTSDWVKMAERARAKRGEYTGSFAPYGYDKVGKRLVVSEDGSAETVRRIFNLYQQGIGMQSIANLLTDEKVPPPAERQSRANSSMFWHLSTIRKILTNPVYTGDLVAQRETVAALGSNRRKKIPKEEQVIVPNNHAVLISYEQFQLVHDIISRRAFGKTKGCPNLFTNFLYCAHCGSGMYYTKRQYGNDHYVCGRYQKRGKKYCCRNPIREDQLKSLILNELRQLAQASVDADALYQEIRKTSTHERRNHEKTEAELRARITKLERRKAIAGDKWLDGELGKELYHETIERLDEELRVEWEKLHKLIRENGTRVKLSLTDVEKFLRMDRLDREMVQVLIKRIDVSEVGKVAITYNFTV